MEEDKWTNTREYTDTREQKDAQTDTLTNRQTHKHVHANGDAQTDTRGETHHRDTGP